MTKKRSVTPLTVLVLLSLACLIPAMAAGKAEEYHHALSLCFQHSADHAKALYDQASNRELNMEIADDYVGQISKDLDRARIYKYSDVHQLFRE